MYLGYYEEGDKCPEKDCSGNLVYLPTENCSCHINPPCSACTDKPLTCEKCGHEEDAHDYNDVTVAPGLTMREYKPKPLDSTKIDYRIKMHSSSSQICEGVYPEGTTQKKVSEVVKGTFGGRFEQFGDGKFKYIAYTD